MSDLIDRQLVLDRINKQREHLRPYLDPQDKIGDSAYQICAEFVERIPSVQPKERCIATITLSKEDIERIVREQVEEIKEMLPRKGKWIGYKADDKDWQRDDGSPIFMNCSECHEAVINNGSAHWNFCPNCGADMRGENE